MQALWVAAMDGDADRVRLLLELGCDPGRVGRVGHDTCAEVASKHGHPEVAALIREWERGEQAGRREN